MNIKFISRNECISCKSKDIKILKSELFTSEIIFNYLQLFYGDNVKDLNLENQKLEYAVCLNCSMVWQKNVLNEEGLEYLYEILISAESSLNKRESGSYNHFSSYIESAKRVKYFFPYRKPRDIKVLDFGMGWGHYCIASKALGHDVYGCELSDVRIKFAQINGVKIIKNILEIEDNYFDFINTEQVFEHLADPSIIMKEFQRILKNDGIINISVPNSVKSIKDLNSSHWKPTNNSLQPLQHINSFTSQTLKNFALNNNFVNITPELNKQISIKTFLKEKIKSYISTSLYFKKNI